MELQKLISRYQHSINTIYRSLNNSIKNHVHSDITTDQFSILQYIYQTQPCTSTQIAQSFAIGKSAVTATVNRLVEKGFINRNRDEADRRIIYLSLSDSGQQVVTETEKEVYRVIGDKLKHFDPTEIEKFIHSLEKLAFLIEKSDDENE